MWILRGKADRDEQILAAVLEALVSSIRCAAVGGRFASRRL